MGRDPRGERAPRTTRCYAINKPRQIQNQIQKHSFKFRNTKIPIGRLEHCSSGTVSLHILLKECFDFCRFRWLMITALKNHCTQQLNIIISRLHCYVSCIGISHRPGRNLSQIRIFWGPQLDWRHLTIIFLSGKVAKVDVDTDLRQHHFKSNYNQELVPPLGQKIDPLGPEYPWGP